MEETTDSFNTKRQPNHGRFAEALEQQEKVLLDSAWKVTVLRSEEMLEPS